MMDPALDPERFAAVQRAFAAAFEVHGAAREARLDAACDGDAELREIVVQLLIDSQAAHPIFDRADGAGAEATHAGRDADAMVRTAGLPEQVDGYHILGVLGHGGMGVVYRAVQRLPRREVALKMLQPGWVQPGAVERFVREAEVLGALEHPGIASVFGAGQVDLGFGEVPYIVMEIVPGERLDRYATERGLGIRARAELIHAVCVAVQHAHERHVVHRDLKPANVLAYDLDGQSVVKVLDFGIARVSADAGSQVSRTLTGQLFGTLPYMSPEQVDGSAATVDGRTDVYALGVMLFEMISGRLPIAVAELPLTEAARRIRDTSPPRLDRVVREVGRDLATIVDRALAKLPDERYPSAGALAADLRRWLEDRPIVARPTSMLHRARLFTRRHRALVYGFAATTVTLLVGLIGMTSFAGSERRARLQLRTAMYSMQMRALGDLLDAPHSAEPLRDLAAAWPDPRGAEPEVRGWEFDLLCAMRDHARRSRLDVPLNEIQTWNDGRLGVQTPRGLSLVTPDAIGAGTTLVPSDDVWGDAMFDPRRAEVVHAARVGVLRWRSVDGSGHGGEVDGIGDIGAIVCDPSGPRVVAVARDRVVVVDRDRGAIAMRLDIAGYEHTAAISADGARLALAPLDRCVVEIWDLSLGKLARTLPTGVLPAYRVGFAPIGERLCVLPRTGDCEVWDLAGGEPRRFAAAGGGMGIDIAWAPDASRVAVGYELGVVTLHEVATGRSVPLRGVENPVTALCWSGDGASIYAGDLLGLLLRWDLADVAPTWSVRPEPVISGPLVDWSTDSGAVVIGRSMIGGLPFDARTGASIGLPQAAAGPGYFSRGLDCVARYVDGRLEVHDGSGRPVADSLSMPEEVLPSVRWSPVEDRLALLVDRELRCLDPRAGAWSPALAGPVGSWLTWAANGEFVVCAGSGRLTLLQIVGDRATQLAEWQGIDGGMAICSDPDGRRLAVALGSGVIQILEVPSGRELARLTGLTGGAESLHWHPQEPRLVSCGGGGLRIWDVDHRHCVLHVDAWTGSARWSPDGRSLAIVQLSGPAHVWHAPATRR